MKMRGLLTIQAGGKGSGSGKKLTTPHRSSVSKSEKKRLVVKSYKDILSEHNFVHAMTVNKEKVYTQEEDGKVLATVKVRATSAMDASGPKMPGSIYWEHQQEAKRDAMCCGAGLHVGYGTKSLENRLIRAKS